MLSTNSLRHPGYPFGSIVPYAFSTDGICSIMISDMAEHYKNLKGDPHASLFVAEAKGHEDPQAHARATILLQFQAEPPDSPLRKAFLEKHPDTIDHSIVHSFHLFAAKIFKVRWIAGFGEMGWVEGGALS